MAVVSSRVSDRALESVCSAVGEMVQSPRKRPRTKKDSQLSNWSEDLGLTDNLQCEGHAEERLATLSEGFGTILEGSDEVPSPFPLAQCVALSNSSNDQLLLSISLDGWIKNYKSDPNSAVVALANFLIGAAGLQKVDLGCIALVDSAKTREDCAANGAGAIEKRPTHVPMCDQEREKMSRDISDETLSLIHI